MNSIKDISPKVIFPGITGYYAHGEKMTFGFIEIKSGSVVPRHHHQQEQITYIIEGHLDLIIEEKLVSLTDGMYCVIPSDTPHSAVAKKDCKLIDTFSPTREDYKPKPD